MPSLEPHLSQNQRVHFSKQGPLKGMTFVGRETSGEVHIGFAITNPNDVGSEDEGYLIADHRLRKHPNYPFRHRSWTTDTGLKVHFYEPREWPWRLRTTRRDRKFRLMALEKMGVPVEAPKGKTNNG